VEQGLVDRSPVAADPLVYPEPSQGPDPNGPCPATDPPTQAVAYPALAAAAKSELFASSYGKAKCLISRPMCRSISAFDRINSSPARSAESLVIIR